MKIVEVEIKNFRGIKSFKQSFLDKDIICLVGRGDSCKSTILEAISYALYPKWNLLFNDNDFYRKETSSPIEIDVSFKIPDGFLLEEKYGQYLRFLNNNNEVCDEPKDEYRKVLTIRLKVEEDLEPKWFVYNKCQDDNSKDINQTDRAKFNCFMISDYIDKHFTWDNSSPLYSLVKGTTDPKKYRSDFIEPIRNALNSINDNKEFEKLNTEINKVDSKLINTKELKTLMDSQDIRLGINKLALHDGQDIPYHAKGKGSKRLLSIIMQLANIEDGAITLIDEIEQGLEPDRIKRLVAKLKDKTKNQNQIFMTTHSNQAITELDAEDLFIIRNNNGIVEAINIDKKLQRLVRGCPDAFFAKKVLVCEGKTELGIIRALDEYRKTKGQMSIAYTGCVPICGNGSSFYDYCQELKNLKYDVLAFCDSDLKDKNKKDILIERGIVVIDCEEGNCIEKQIFKDLPYSAIVELIEHVIEDPELYEGEESRLIQRVQSKYSSFPDNWKNITNDNEIVRNAFTEASLGIVKDDNASHKSVWFKNETAGKTLGKVIHKYFDTLNEDKGIKKQLLEINEWIGE